MSAQSNPALNGLPMLQKPKKHKPHNPVPGGRTVLCKKRFMQPE
jgi:hypothetical protein